MEMDVQAWIDLLSRAHAPSSEAVIYTAPFRKSLRIRKDAWLQHWKGMGGLALRSGPEIELFPCDEGGGWCGCGYLDAKVQVPASAEAVDLEGAAVTDRNEPHAIDWYPGPKEILQPVFDGHMEAAAAGAAGERRALLVKSWHNTGLCTMVMHRALSYHPRYAGSRLEVSGALRLAYVQSAAGTWGEMVLLSTMLGFLSRSTHPLAAFLVLRSVPLLMRTQGSDGLWHEPPLAYLDEATPPPTPTESTYLILCALERYGFLEALLPG